MALKKTWYEIVAPEMFGSKVVGETLAVDAKQIVGRKISISLLEFGRDFQKFYIKLNLKIQKVEGGKAYAEFVGHEVIAERLYRMVQRRTRRVDCIQETTTKDGKKLRVKTIMILSRRVGTSIKHKARAKLKETVEAIVKEKSLEELIKMIIDDELQRQIWSECKKIYPVSAVEIRKTEVSA
ncbi:MAG: 30S ribosomal protein S3ae [Candidatus Aenigmarchaeota archaeon]|nr:30S ribosomal protein S3ae [Candidatus Aenigmarchaeota archaeon]